MYSQYIKKIKIQHKSQREELFVRFSMSFCTVEKDKVECLHDVVRSDDGEDDFQVGRKLIHLSRVGCEGSVLSPAF
jgi:hypothetical protein